MTLAHAADIVRRDVAAADKTVGRFGRACHSEVQHAFGQRTDAARRLVVRRHTQHGGERRNLVSQPQRLAPVAGIALRAIGNQHLGTACRHQSHQLLVGQQRVERLRDAGSACAPERQVVFKTARQQNRHGVMGAHAEPVQQVGGAVNSRQQFRVGPTDRFIGRVSRPKKGQGRLVAKGGGRIPEDFVGAAHGQRLGKRRLLKPLHVRDLADGKGCAERRCSRNRGHRFVSRAKRAFFQQKNGFDSRIAN